MTGEEVQSYKVKICMLGNESVGKTSLIRRFVLDQFSDEYIPTLGTKISKKELLIKDDDGRVFHLVLLVHDINGHWSTLNRTVEDFQKMVHANYYSNAEGLLLVCDITRKDTFLDYDFWRGNIAHALGRELPCVYLGNKADLKDSSKVTPEDIEELKQLKQAPFLYTSARTGENVEQAFEELGRLVLKGILSKQ